MLMKLAAVLLGVAVSLGLGAGCEQNEAKKPAQKSKRAVSESNPATKGSSEKVEIAEPDGTFRFPEASRVVAIGDLHGDFAATRRAFALAGAIDEDAKWSGGDLVVVQTGDQLDRGPEEREIIEFLRRLKKEANAAGGRVIVLNGNHETMNVMGDFRYVAPGAMDAFDSYEPPSPLSVEVEGPAKSRAAAFLPGGGAAQILSKRPLVVMVGDAVFAHGGVLPEHIDYGIERLNEESQKWMAGESTLPPRPVVAPNGPLWTRLYSQGTPSAQACATLVRALERLGAELMVVGHTVQERGMSAGCDDRVYRIDVGLAAHYGDRPVQVLEIEEGTAKILTAAP